MARRDRLRSEYGTDSGMTLVETLVALSILSVAGVAILAGLELTVKSSDIHRKQSLGGANVRNYVEAVQDYVAGGNYDPCGDGVNYLPTSDADSPNAPGPVPFTVPDGFDAGYDDVNALDGDGSELDAGCAADAGVQRIRFTMTAEDGRASEELVVILRRSCAPTEATSC